MTWKEHYEKNKDAKKKLSRNQRYEENKDAEKLSRKQHYESYNTLIVVTKNKKYVAINVNFFNIYSNFRTWPMGWRGGQVRQG